MNIPIVTLDKIYIKPDEENIFYLDCTRVNGTNEIIARKDESIDDQIKRICEVLKQKEIILADDVVFSGTVIKTIITKFKSYGVNVVELISSISTIGGYKYFNDNLRYGVRTNYLMLDDVIDQICERDFYFGIAGSGISDGLYKAPYFKPYGNPYERASIPIEYEREFSKGCLERSIILWEEIDRLKKVRTLIGELPEKIINTNIDEEVVKTLRREYRKI